MSLSRRACLLALVVVLVATGLVLSPAPHADAARGSVDVVVTFTQASPAVVRARVAEVRAQHDVTVQRELPHLRMAAMRVPQARLAALRATPGILSVDEDITLTVAGQPTPRHLSRIAADRAGVSGEVAATIAVLDTGIDGGHPQLDVVAATDCSMLVCVDGEARDVNGHGTMVAGIAAARDDATAPLGTAPGADLVSVKVLSDTGNGTLSAVVAGIEWVIARGGVDVINLSLGCRCDPPAALEAAMKAAVEAGIVVVAAAGNAGGDASDYTPASSPHTIAVSAIVDTDGKPGGSGTSLQCTGHGLDDHHATFSNVGAVVDIAAPGVCIQTTAPGGALASFTGTSAAAPVVAGAAAWYVAEQRIARSPARHATVRNALRASYAVAPTSPCGYTPRKGSEPLLYLVPCAASGALTLSAAQAGDRVTVSWPTPAISGAATLRLVRDVAGSRSTLTLPLSTTSWNDRDLTDGQTIGYTLEARTLAGSVLARSAEALVNVDLVAPAAPKLEARPGTGGATLAWTGPISAVRYELRRSTGACTALSATVYRGTGRITEVSPLKPGVTYRFCVTAEDRAGNVSVLSNVAEVTLDVSDTPPDLAPSPGADLGLVAVAGDAQVRLAWTRPPDVERFELHRGTTSCSRSSAVVQSGVTATATVAPLANGTTYRFCVTGFTEAGDVLVSAPVEATPQDSTAPTSPRLGRVVGGDGRAVMRWNDVFDPSGPVTYELVASSAARCTSRDPVLSTTSRTEVSAPRMVVPLTVCVVAVDRSGNRSIPSNGVRASK